MKQLYHVPVLTGYNEQKKKKSGIGKLNSLDCHPVDTHSVGSTVLREHILHHTVNVLKHNHMHKNVPNRYINYVLISF